MKLVKAIASALEELSRLESVARSGGCTTDYERRVEIANQKIRELILIEHDALAARVAALEKQIADYLAEELPPENIGPVGTPCQRCGGKGYMLETSETPPAGLADKSACKRCNGTGKATIKPARPGAFYEIDCPDCTPEPAGPRLYDEATLRALAPNWMPGFNEMKVVRDSTGREIMEGDLLRTPHFRHGKRQVYLYHVVRESEGHLEMVPINYEKHNGGKCWLLDSVGRNATIIDSRLRGKNLEAWYERPRVEPQEVPTHFTESGRHPPMGFPGEDDYRQTKEDDK